MCHHQIALLDEFSYCHDEIIEFLIAVSRMVGFRNIMSEMGLEQTEATTIYQDNEAAIQIALNRGALSKQSRHIDRLNRKSSETPPVQNPVQRELASPRRQPVQRETQPGSPKRLSQSEETTSPKRDATRQFEEKDQKQGQNADTNQDSTTTTNHRSRVQKTSPGLQHKGEIRKTKIERKDTSHLRGRHQRRRTRRRDNNPLYSR